MEASSSALENRPRTPVLWLHGLECTCCSESFIRSAHPLTKDVVLSMLSLDYDDTLMAAAGESCVASSTVMNGPVTQMISCAEASSENSGVSCRPETIFG